MIDVVGLLTIILEGLAFFIALLIGARFLKIYWTVPDEQLGFLGMGFMLVSLSSFIFALIPLVEEPFWLIYFYLAAALMDAFGYMMMAFSYFYKGISKKFYQIIPFALGAHSISLFALAILSYHTLQRKSIFTGIGFMILLVQHIMDLSGFLQSSPDFLVLSEILRPYGLLLLLIGLRE
ncbi:MAG: hypothetical protein QW128_02335 [Thermoprotei archaeon]